MATVTMNTALSLAYSETVGLLEKLVKQYIDGAQLEDRFGLFDRDGVEYGKGYEIATVLSAEKEGSGGSSKSEEHGTYRPKIMDIVMQDTVGDQYRVTLDKRRVAECVGDSAAAQQYAAELTESLMQGWLADKNKAVGKLANDIIGKREALSAGMTVTLTDGEEDKFAQTVLATLKGKVEDLKEGVTGTSYGNSFIGEKEIAAHDVVVIMSNAFAAFLDVHGFARVLSPEYLQTSRVSRVTSSKIKDGTVLITDARNIQTRRKYEEFVTILNSDGSQNMFYNKYDYIGAAIINDGGTYDGQIGYPFYVIEKAEA